MNQARTKSRRDLDWKDFGERLGGIPFTVDRNVIRQKSLDFYWYSPVLKRELDGTVADIVVTPRGDVDILAVARACVARKVPLVVRGGGTGNYGQVAPLEGGVILDMTAMNAIRWLRPGMIRCEAGLLLHRIDEEARKIGWELRLYPSTKRTATIGGFIGGGSSGVGAIQNGLLRDPGNINCLRVVTMEDEPRVIELRGGDVNKVNHAYGTNGIISEIELSLTPAHAWVDNLVVFDDFMAGARFGHAVSAAEGIVKKEMSVYAAPIPEYFRPLRKHVAAGKALAIAMVAQESIEWFDHLVRSHGGALVYRNDMVEGAKETPLYEYCWNHTTLHALKADPAITYLQCVFGPNNHLQQIEHMYHHFGDEAPMHIEFVRFEGSIACFGLQLFRFSTEARLAEAIAYLEGHGVPVFNPHTYVLEDGGMKTVDAEQLGFKRLADPHGLMNPGKMRGWWEQAAVPRKAGALYR
jgi:FAD/FMN-containing dehydrogenase